MTDASGGDGAPAPIVVNPSPIPDQVEGQIALLVNSGGGLALAYGAMSQTKEAALAGFLCVALTMAWRFYRTQIQHEQRVTMANAAPDSVAQVARK